MALVPPTPKDLTETEKTSKKTSLDTSSLSVKKASASLDPSHTVRTSSCDQKLDKHRYHNTSITIREKTTVSSTTLSPLASIVFPRKIKLTSIELLRQSIDDDCDRDLLDIIRKFCLCWNN